ncbi:TPA: hypothetical protein I8Y21_005765 [Klebsiella oxytoca]|uniref:Uncharacterized protein n=1 Tax=Klebsiella oxytoca TaxID=571 RepID=A0AAN5LEK2_KLEOX|nr:hypothetical protein [Klebsiella oxytoca]
MSDNEDEMFESTHMFTLPVCEEICELHDSVEALACASCHVFMGFSGRSRLYQNDILCRRQQNDFHDFFDEIHEAVTSGSVVPDCSGSDADGLPRK